MGKTSCGVSLKLEKVQHLGATTTNFNAVAAQDRVGTAASYAETQSNLSHLSDKCGVHQGLPLGSGMGSSAASAAAAAWAVNVLFGEPLTKEQLIIPGLASEATVSGNHADNIAPAILGGFVLIRYSQLTTSTASPSTQDFSSVMQH